MFTTEKSEIQLEQSEKKSDSESHSSPMSIPDRTPFSQKKPPATDHDASGVKKTIGNKNYTQSDRLWNAFLKHTDALPASEAGAFYNAHVQEKKHLKTFFTLFNHTDNFKCSSNDRKQSLSLFLRFGKGDVWTCARMTCTLFL